ncbi:MAG: tyrosine-type recombinase/integrase [Lachnospiraceae bacterium]
MARRGENIFHRQDKRWEGRYKKGRKPNGKLLYGYIYGKTYKEVKLRLIELKYKYMNSEKELINFNGTVYNWSIHYLEKIMNSGIKSSTYAIYNTMLQNHILPYFENKKLIAVTKNDVGEFVQCLTGKGLSGNSVHGVFGLLNRMLKCGVDERALLLNPCDEVILPKKEPRKIEVLTVEEQQKLEQAALKEEDGAAVVTALYTGMRIGEIAALRWEDINFDMGMIHVNQTVQRIADVDGENKTKLVFSSPKSEKSNRLIPMTEKTKSWFQSLRQDSQGEYVIACKDGFAEPRVIRYRYVKIVDKAGLKYVPFHSLRHTFATRCLEQGVDPTNLSSIMGHSSSKMTLDVYTDSLLEQRIISMGKIDKLFVYSPETIGVC